MKNYLTILSILVMLSCKAQYPFEVFPRISYAAYKIAQYYSESDSSYIGISTIPTKNAFSTIRIEFKELDDDDSCNIFIYKADSLFQTIMEPLGVYPFLLPDSLYVADLNNDSFLDIKFFIHNTGCGLAASLMGKVYLIGRMDGTFDKFSFMDFSTEIERDMDGDTIYEIIGVDHDGFENHNYWIYDLFNIKDRQFINVSKNFDYPIMIQHLFRRNFAITQNISRIKMKEFSRQKPDYYDERK